MINDDHGFSLIELLIALTVLGVLAVMIVPQLMRGYERSRQRTSMADMRAIAVANATYHTDNGSYAAGLVDLAPDFMNPVPPADAWGTAWTYARPSDNNYTLTSYGRDGTAGPASPVPWVDEPFEPDLVLTNGAFVQVPDTTR